jgi:hypothetical protein
MNNSEKVLEQSPIQNRSVLVRNSGVEYAQEIVVGALSCDCRAVWTGGDHSRR